MLKPLIALAGITLSMASQAAIVTITSDENLGTPLATGSISFYQEIIGAEISFAHSLHFTTDGLAQLGSATAVGLDLSGISGFVGDLTISLYEGTYVASDIFNDQLILPVASITGTQLSNIPVEANTQYSFIVSGVTSGETSNNAISGAVSISAVPVPAAAWLFGSALISISILRRKP